MGGRRFFRVFCGFFGISVCFVVVFCVFVCYVCIF